MTLPASGSISLDQVNTELGRSATASISLGETAVRTLFGKASGAISLADGYGKSNGPSIVAGSKFVSDVSYNGYGSGFGTLGGTGKVKDQTITGFYRQTDTIEFTYDDVVLEVSGLVAQNYFASITIDGKTFNSSSAYNYFQSAGKTYWFWAPQSWSLTAGTTYQITVT